MFVSMAAPRPRDRSDLAGWQRNVTFALAVAALVCERRGGAVAMPTNEELTARWGSLV